MPIISNPKNTWYDHHFIFIENTILIRAGGGTPPLTSSSLPTAETLEKCLRNHAASDWFAEPEHGYSAMLLEKDSPVPAGCTAIPLRQFFWDCKTAQEQRECQTSLLGGLATRAHSFLRLREKFRFCPTCGTSLTDDPDFTAKRCPNCDRQFFPQIEPAVIVLVSRGDEILLVKNKNRSHDFYSCVAGFVEQGETIEQCVAREVMEETNIRIHNIRYVGSQPWPFPDQLMLAFTADYQDGEVKIQESELVAGGWFAKDELPAIPAPGSIAYNLITGLYGKRDT